MCLAWFINQPFYCFQFDDSIRVWNFIYRSNDYLVMSVESIEKIHHQIQIIIIHFIFWRIYNNR